MSSQRFDYLILIFFLIFSFLFDTGSEGAKVTGHIHSMAPASADTVSSLGCKQDDATDLGRQRKWSAMYIYIARHQLMS